MQTKHATSNEGGGGGWWESTALPSSGVEWRRWALTEEPQRINDGRLRDAGSLRGREQRRLVERIGQEGGDSGRPGRGQRRQQHRRQQREEDGREAGGVGWPVLLQPLHVQLLGGMEDGSELRLTP